MTIARKNRVRNFAVGVGLLALGAVAYNGFTPPTRAAAGMSPIDRVVAESEINQQLALYTLLDDGDGLNKPDIRGLVDKLYVKDGSFDNYSWDGKLGFKRPGREVIYQRATEHAVPGDGPISDRHFNVATYFDELTPTAAKTRTVALVLKITRNMLGADCKKAGEDACGGRVVFASTFVYHDTWAKTAEGWQKTQSDLRSDQ